MDKEKIIEILNEDYRYQAEKQGWDDIKFLTDDEVKFMNPPAGEDLLFLIAKKKRQLAEVRETLKYLESKLNDPRLSSYFKTETRQDIRDERLEEMRLIAEIESAEKEYGEDYSKFR